MKMNRRQFVKSAAIAGAAVTVPWKLGTGTAYAMANSDRLQKWIQPLRGLGGSGIPIASSKPDPVFANTQFYQITAGEFLDQLHPQLPPTRLLGYWDTLNPVPRHLGGLIIANRGTASRIRFTNKLQEPSIIPVDTSIPGANQAQNRMAIHLHGGFIPWISDGGPFNWWSPNGSSGASFLNGPGSIFDNIFRLPNYPDQPMLAGQADYFYPNDQSTRLMWYHDHAHGITRTNAYAGLATGYVLVDANFDAVKAVGGMVPGLPSALPLIFQDKKFVSSTTILTDPTWGTVARNDCTGIGSLWYEHVYNPKEFKLAPGGLPLPNPSCIPEFFGDTMLCNGTVYPVATLEAKRYRFLVLNACNARFLNINLLQAPPGGEVATDPLTLFPNTKKKHPAGPPIIQIGNECGYLWTEATFPNGIPFNPVTLTGNLLLAPAERADIIIDFTGCAGKEYVFYNDAPGPFPVGPATNDYFLGNKGNPVQPLAGTGPDTRQILRVKVVATVNPDPQPPGPILNPLLDPAPIVMPTTAVAPIPPLVAPPGTPVRDLTLNEDFDQWGRLRQVLGTTTPGLFGGNGYGLDYLAPPTENIAAGSTEVWRIFNLTADTHPIHFHLVNVQVLSREAFALRGGKFVLSGAPRGPQPNELGWKETVQMHPGDVTTVIMKFDLPATPFPVPASPRTGGNEYVWHCHILEHEEHDMMRPLVVT